MRVSDKAIILQATKYGDKKHILKLYTYRHGLLTVIASVGRSPSSKIRLANILPLSMIEVEFVYKQNKEIHTLTEASSYFVLNHVWESLLKLTIAQFLNEILIKSLKEQNANHHLFEFIETCLRYLNDSEDNFMNLHLYFMLEFSKYLGFEPQNNYSKDLPFFDLREGRFSIVSLTFPLALSREDSEYFSKALDLNLLNTNVSNTQRQLLLEILIAYYKLHIPAFNEIKSLYVLREVLAH